MSKDFRPTPPSSHFQHLVDHARDVLYILSLDGTIVFLNPAFELHTGWPVSEWIGKPFAPLVHPDDLALALLNFQRALKKENPPLFELRILTKPGGYRIGEFLEREFIQDQRLAGVLGIARDITERKAIEHALNESDARLRAILDHSPALIFLKDTQGRYLLVNREFETVFHMNLNNILGKTDADLFPPEQASAFQANDRRVLEAGVPLEFEETARHDDGPHTSIVVKFPLRDVTGRIQGVGGIVTDITERKKAMDQLRTVAARMEMMRETENARLAQQIRDDLVDPLTGVKLDLELAIRQLGDVNPGFSKRMEGMVALLRTALTRIRTITTELRPAVLDQYGLLPAIEWLAGDLRSRTGITCTVSLEIREPPLSADRKTVLLRILQELLAHASLDGRARTIVIGVREEPGKVIVDVLDEERRLTHAQDAELNFALIAMQHRASFVGGAVAATPDAGGKAVRITMPCEDADR
jgi:PAS domain S-box-containing protein